MLGQNSWPPFGVLTTLCYFLCNKRGQYSSCIRWLYYEENYGLLCSGACWCGSTFFYATTAFSETSNFCLCGWCGVWMIFFLFAPFAKWLVIPYLHVGTTLKVIGLNIIMFLGLIWRQGRKIWNLKLHT